MDLGHHNGRKEEGKRPGQLAMEALCAKLNTWAKLLRAATPALCILLALNGCALGPAAIAGLALSIPGALDSTHNILHRLNQPDEGDDLKIILDKLDHKDTR